MSKENEIVMYNVNDRSKIISDIMDIFEKTDLTPVDCYGILEHVKFEIQNEGFGAVLSDMLFGDEDEE